MTPEDQTQENENSVKDSCEKIFGVIGEALERTSSRRLMMTGGLGAVMAGMMAQSGEAAPKDVLGSPNVAIRSYKNEEGIFVLWADGRITDAKSGKEVGNPKNYKTPAGFSPPSLVRGRPAGSPNVAVDVIQDENGTFVLFADGSVRQPNLGGAGAPGFGDWELFSGGFDRGVMSAQTPNITISGGGFVTFEKPFREVPFIWIYYRVEDHFIQWTHYAGFEQPTTTSWNATRYLTHSSGKNVTGGFWGMGLR